MGFDALVGSAVVTFQGLIRTFGPQSTHSTVSYSTCLCPGAREHDLAWRYTHDYSYDATGQCSEWQLSRQTEKELEDPGQVLTRLTN